MEKDIIIFSAPSGSGKTTILKHLFEKNPELFNFSISATSRPKRDNEIHGKDYYFLTEEEFRKKLANNEFLEWEEVYNGTLYGTLKSEIKRIRSNNKIIAFDVDVNGGINIKKLFGDSAVSVFVMPPSVEELRRRLEFRATDSPESIAKRIERSEMELTQSKYFDYTILNDNIDIAVEQAQNIIQTEFKQIFLND
ncbi:MAG: guanylate kinase [Bacteroidales bacterium]|jgi:guanylate kinase|nr:guanylate kinase [Bacteroidales bacterium]